MVGGAMAADLAKTPGFEVTVADMNRKRLEQLKGMHPLETRQVDLSVSENVKALVTDFDFAVDAVPGFLGFQTFKAIIESGTNVVDIAFFPEDPFALNDLAKEKKVIAVMDCGVAPGMSNLLAGYVAHLLDEVETVEIYVGGLPQVRRWPYEYQAVFSPIDVIEEYTRPDRYVENGRLVTRPALSDPELIDFEGIGTLEAFNTDGLRTLAQTLTAPNMKEKTLRYPGHIEKMAVLRETGFFSREPVEINGSKIRPIDFTAKLLFPRWQMKPGDEDLTVMKVLVEGKKAGRRLRYVYDLFDRYDRESETTSMARTTGYTATAAVRMIAAGKFDRVGVSPPEYIGQQPECVEFMLNELSRRGVVYRETVTEI